MAKRRRWTLAAAAIALVTPALSVAPTMGRDTATAPPSAQPAAAAAAAVRPNIFFYNVDDLRDAFPGGIDPLQFMPQVRQWMEGQATRYTQTFVADPSCCPSRSTLMTGRYPHNNGVLNQQDGPKFDGTHSMACYLRSAGYSTYLDGKFLTTWPRTSFPRASSTRP